nr:hypothetical protein [Nodosilinea sp. TSF1-S3]
MPQPAGLGPFGEAQAAGSPSPPLPGLAGAIAPPRPPEALEPEAPDASAAVPVATPVSPRVAPPPLTLVSPTLGPGSAAKHSAADLPALGTPPWPQDPEPVPAASPETVGRPPNEFALGTDPGASVDLSDIIAQTDVELQRLGWGVNQGREFLEKTYGKRSRHDLTDDELLEFLLFLETQPSPGSP